MLKKNILVFGAGLMTWYSISILFYPIIVTFIVEHNYPLFLNNIFYSCQSAISGLVVGYFGRLKGWLSGLILGCLITITVYLFTIVLGSSNGNLGLTLSTKHLLSLIITYFLFTVFSILGAMAGEMLKKWKGRTLGTP
jgi:hypothetical protein